MDIKFITYNIDGLPESLDVRDLPWILKPVAWIYRLVKKTPFVYLNDNDGTAKKIAEIGKRLFISDADVIAVQEDFNFHDVLMEGLRGYSCGTHKGGFDMKKIFSSTEWLSRFPLPRFKCDGLNVITKDRTVQVSGEDTVSWGKSYGYFSHANDLLTHKGFRHYKMTVFGLYMDVYNVHMDADFYREGIDVNGDIEARRAQYEQLAGYIINRNAKNPVVVMGDTNSLIGYSWDDDNVKNHFVDTLMASGMTVEEVLPNNDVDRVFVINNSECRYALVAKESGYLTEFDGLSDHRPFRVVFDVILKES